MKKAVGSGTSDNVNVGVKKGVAIGGGSGTADVNKERQLGRRDIVTDTDNRPLQSRTRLATLTGADQVT